MGKAGLRCNYDIITSPAVDSTTVTAVLMAMLHALGSVTGTWYHETGKRGLGGGLHCPSASSYYYCWLVLCVLLQYNTIQYNTVMKLHDTLKSENAEVLVLAS